MINAPVPLEPWTDAHAPSCAASFEQLYAAHAASVHRFCLSQLGDGAAAEDLTHDTFVRAWGPYHKSPVPPGAARVWLLAIARNLSVDHHRRVGGWRHAVARHLAQPIAPPPDIEVLAEDRSELRRVAAALARMRTRDRQLIGLRVAADLSYREVAGVLGLNEAAAKVATNRALRRLRELLAGSPARNTKEDAG